LNDLKIKELKKQVVPTNKMRAGDGRREQRNNLSADSKIDVDSS